LFFSFLAMCDIGFAIHERMALDQVLRSGAQLAMSDPGEDELRALLAITAEREFSVRDEPPDGFDTNVIRYCACPDEPETPVQCSASCAGSRSIAAFYSLSAQGSYDGFILPLIRFSPAIKVQVR